jgi:hypothetical protein
VTNGVSQFPGVAGSKTDPPCGKAYRGGFEANFPRQVCALFLHKIANKIGRPVENEKGAAG